MRILIAEHDPACRATLKEALENMGHEVFVAEGRTAIEVFERMGPDVIFSALVLPGGLDGYEFCKKVRSAETEAYTYFSILASTDETESAIAALEAGADDCFTKPISRPEIEVRMIAASRVLSLHRQLAEHDMEMLRIEREILDDGRRDPLTKVGSRLRMEEDLDSLSGRAKRYGHSFSVLLCQVDNFKGYVDACGEKAGEETLRSVARTIANHGRSGDTAYRYADHVFMVVLPEQSVDGALIAAERRRVAVEKLALPHPGKGSVTISVGVVQFEVTEEGSGVQLLFERAASALGLADKQNANSIAVFRDGQTSIPPDMPSNPPPA